MTTRLRFSRRISLENSVLLFLMMAGLGFLTSCGGGTHAAPPVVSHVPAFSSRPPGAASEGVTYSYSLAATAPDGSSVSFALTTAPTGAVLSGNTITWTPTHAQSRIASNFAVSATTAAGGSASQSWSVTPAGNIQISWINTYWTENGPVEVPVTLNLLPFLEVVVPQADGSYQVLHPTSQANGVITVPGVPGGYYWLQLAPGANFWTNTSSFDFGSDFIGRNFFQPGPPGNTTLNLNVGGLDPIQPQDWFGFIMDNHFNLLESPIFGSQGATSFQEVADIGGDIDWSQVKTIFLGQYEAASPSSLNALALGPALTLSDVSLSNGANNNINATLTSSPVKSVNLDIHGSDWAAMLSNVAPASVTPVGSVLAVSAQPLLTDRNAIGWDRPLGPNLPLIAPHITTNGWSSGMSSCADSSTLISRPSSFPFASQPPILTDQDFGAVSYGDPYPAEWPRVFTFCEKATVSIPIPNSSATTSFLLQYGETTQLPAAPVSPLVTPVENPTVNGASLFTPVTLNRTAVTLNWSPPSGAQPYGYYITEFVLINQNGNPVYAETGRFGAAHAPITLPPLARGYTYIFLIAAELDGRANIETSPNRSTLPTAYANVVSAPITISSTAAGPVIHDQSSTDAAPIVQYQTSARANASAGNNQNGSASDPSSPAFDINTYEPFPFRPGRRLPAVVGGDSRANISPPASPPGKM